MLVAKAMFNMVLWRSALGLIINVVLNIFLIKSYGAFGAAISTLVAQVLASFLANLFFVNSRQVFFTQLQIIMPFKMKIEG
jgi:O-antigen/teichoic acid export membrane protein